MNDPTILSQAEKEELFFKLLQKEYDCYVFILELTRNENDMLTQSALSGLNSLMKKKKIILECIYDINKKKQPLGKEWRENKKKSTSCDIKKQLETLKVLIKEILDLDYKNQIIFKKHLNHLKTNLTKNS